MRASLEQTRDGQARLPPSTINQHGCVQHPRQNPRLFPHRGLLNGRGEGAEEASLSLLLHFLLFLLLNNGLDAASNEVQIPLSIGGNGAALGGRTGGHDINVRQLQPSNQRVSGQLLLHASSHIEAAHPLALYHNKSLEICCVQGNANPHI